VSHEPVVLFALEWCEFSWSVRKLFARLGIAYRSIDLDSVAFQHGDLGGKLRAVLAARTGTRTIPQVFIGGTHVGGATELFDAWRSGKARELLGIRGVAFDAGADLDPYSLLPKWLQPRKSA
jgi:cysteine synthase A